MHRIEYKIGVKGPEASVANAVMFLKSHHGMFTAAAEVARDRATILMISGIAHDQMDINKFHAAISELVDCLELPVVNVQFRLLEIGKWQTIED